jgi:hypothetical protein
MPTDYTETLFPDSVIGHVQERLWRLRAKRAWIREEIQALHGFPDEDADYEEPWNDALGEFY